MRESLYQFLDETLSNKDQIELDKVFEQHKKDCITNLIRN